MLLDLAMIALTLLWALGFALNLELARRLAR
jgi:hypothetical protein